MIIKSQQVCFRVAYTFIQKFYTFIELNEFICLQLRLTIENQFVLIKSFKKIINTKQIRRIDNILSTNFFLFTYIN